MRHVFRAALALLCLLIVVPSFAAPTCVQGAAGVPPTATLKFTAPTTNTDGTPVNGPLTYTLFAGASSGTESQIATALSGSPVNVTTGLLPGTTVYFYIVAVDAKGNASAPSNEACKAFPVSVPGTVTITIS